jgi:2-polyprenyl-3-methyl-5-hydroxy-6-metoxy-1,4-benzoquinol methylase
MGERHERCPTCGATELAFVFRDEPYELVRCGACDLVFVVNPPTDEELSRFYSFASGYHMQLRDDEAQIAERRSAARRQLAAIMRHRPQPGRLLDIGATAGFFVQAAGEAGWDATGVELSADTAEIARERYGLDVRTGRLEDLDFEDASSDAVTLWDVIEHVRDPLDTMRRVARLVRPGGVVGLLTPNLDGLFPRVSYKIANLVGGWPAVEPPAHLFQFSERTLGDLLSRTGFEVLQVDHEAQPIGYTFGSVRRDPSPKRIAYKAVFAPLALLGPRVGAGDEILVVARKPG